MEKPAIILAGYNALRKGAGFAPQLLKKGGEMMNRGFTGVHQAALLLAVAGIAAKTLALLRDRILASTFGAGLTLDIYYAAFRVPDIVYTVALFLSASTALIPIILEQEKVGRERTKKFIGTIISWFTVIFAAIGIAAYLAMPFITKVITPGLDNVDQKTVTILAQILLLQSFLLGLSGIISSIVQTFKKFFIYALSPIVYNLGIIAGILYFYPNWGLTGLMFGVVLGALLHLAIQLPSVITLGFWPRMSFKITPEVKSAVALSLPRTLGISFSQSIFVVATAIASTLGAGSIAIFNLSYNLQSVPLTIIGVSYSVAAFPFLAGIAMKEDSQKFLVHFYSAFRHIVFWSLPATVLIIVLRAHIVRVILGTGHFSWADTRLTAAALALFSLSILSQGLIALYIRAFYAAGKTKIPLAISAVGATITITLSWVFARLYLNFETISSFLSAAMRVPDVKNSAILALPLAFSLGSLIALILFAYYFNKEWGRLDGKIFLYSILQMTFASVMAGVIAFVALRVLNNLFNLETFTGIFSHGALAGVAGITVWIAFLVFSKNRELLEIRGAFKARFWKTRIITASEPSTGTEL